MFPCLFRREEARVHREEVKYVRSYEMVVIFKADIEDHKTVSDEIAEIVRGLGAEVEKVDLWGKKRFAYPIEKELEGFYTLYTFKLDPAQVKEMERLLSLRQSVVRHMVVNLEEK
ncbi:30S ribosomal protein S6 [Cloacibacillus sp. An23]|uniref:30S ribosomal protein S6 n=1 Tax=Cloacibacillus sp. An23 TaxID=1965591 RepID=UPI0031B80BC2